MFSIQDVTMRKIEEIEQSLPDFLQKKENCIIYDWLTVSSKCDSPESMIEILGLQDLPFQIMPGFHGYRQRLYYDGISVHFDGHNEQMGICLDMSGQGCRVFETFGHSDWSRLFETFTVTKEGYNFTRLDIAYDDFTGLIPLEKIAKMVMKEQFVAKAKKWTVEQSSDGLTVYIGSKKSNVLIRFYDKAAERGYENDVHWVRCEIQFRKERAENFVKCDKKIGEKFACVLNNYLRFVNSSQTDSNKARWKTCKFWLDFVQTIEKISIFTAKKIDYNLSRVDYFVFQQAGNCIDTYIQCVGLDNFLKRLKERESSLKKKHLAVISEWKSSHEKSKKQTSDDV
jgi:phage replication initiation protein